jgi:hypothetical protein
MKIEQCHILWNGATGAAIKRSVGDNERGSAVTGNGSQYTLHDVVIEEAGDGLVSVEGDMALHIYWAGDMFDAPGPPEDWPTYTHERSKWNPMRFLYGNSYVVPHRGWHQTGTKRIKILVSPTFLAGVPE